MSASGDLASARKDRARQVARVLWIELVLNWAISAIKIVFGVMTGTMVIVADGFHSLSDGTSNIIGLIAIRIAGEPPDAEHPYGHQKFETLASVVVAALLFLAAFVILKEAVGGFFQERHPQVSGLSFVIMGATLVVNLFVVIYQRREAFRLKSELLLSDSWHTLTDVFVTLSVFIALFGIKAGVPKLDSIISFLIAALIARIAIHILRRCVDILVDKAVVDNRLIQRIVMDIDGVMDCHEIRSRGRADSVYVDLHVLVEPLMTVKDSHDIANKIERNIRTEIPGIYDVVVHVEPITHEHDQLEH